MVGVPGYGLGVARRMPKIAAIRFCCAQQRRRQLQPAGEPDRHGQPIQALGHPMAMSRFDRHAQALLKQSLCSHGLSRFNEQVSQATARRGCDVFLTLRTKQTKRLLDKRYSSVAITDLRHGKAKIEQRWGEELGVAKRSADRHSLLKQWDGVGRSTLGASRHADHGKSVSNCQWVVKNRRDIRRFSSLRAVAAA